MRILWKKKGSLYFSNCAAKKQERYNQVRSLFFNIRTFAVHISWHTTWTDQNSKKTPTTKVSVFQNLVEVRRIELLSEATSSRASTCVVYVLGIPQPYAPTDRIKRSGSFIMPIYPQSLRKSVPGVNHTPAGLSCRCRLLRRRNLRPTCCP